MTTPVYRYIDVEETIVQSDDLTWSGLRTAPEVADITEEEILPYEAST